MFKTNLESLERLKIYRYDKAQFSHSSGVIKIQAPTQETGHKFPGLLIKIDLKLKPLQRYIIRLHGRLNENQTLVWIGKHPKQLSKGLYSVWNKGEKYFKIFKPDSEGIYYLGIFLDQPKADDYIYLKSVSLEGSEYKLEPSKTKSVLDLSEILDNLALSENHKNLNSIPLTLDMDSNRDKMIADSEIKVLGKSIGYNILE